ncbi:MAG TPA: hypothetical protein VGL91_17270 [Acidobacteriota bacterium]
MATKLTKVLRPKLVWDRARQGCEISLGSVRIVVAPEDAPPFRVDVVAAEEDTFLVLSSGVEIEEPREHPIRITNRAFTTDPAKPGSVVVRGNNPIRLLAIVHDLSREPSWREEWVASALREILLEVDRRNLQSLALPLLGTLHGSLEKRRFVSLLKLALDGKAPGRLKDLWLIAPPGSRLEILEMLKS